MLAVVATAGLVATVIVVGAITPGYDHQRETVSRLASPGASHAGVVRAAIVIYGLSVVLAIGQLSGLVGARARLLVVAVRACGSAVVVAGLAPKDHPRVPVTWTSELHVGAVVFAGAMLMVAMVLVGAFGGRRVVRRVSWATGGMVLITASVFPLAWG